MRKKYDLIKYIILNILILSIIYLSYINNFRICLTYNLFKIPCPGCGLTTSLVSLLHGDILKSLQYNILTIPLIITYAFFSFWYILDLIRNKTTLNEFFYKNKSKLIFICIIIFIIVSIRNITNPLLYS